MVNAKPLSMRDLHVRVPFSDSPRVPARLMFDSGAAHIGVCATAGDVLLEADFDAPLPTVWANGNNVHVEYPLRRRIGLGRGKHGSVRLNPAVPWTLDVHSTAAGMDADLVGVEVRSVTFHSAAEHVRLALDLPAGSCPVRFTSVGQVRIERPPHVLVRVDVLGEARDLVIDDRRVTTAGRTTEYSSGSYDSENHYLVTVSGHARGLVIDSLR